MQPLLNGILTGLFLQLAIGPVFFYILGIAMDSSFMTSFFGVLAVTLVDYIYILLSILGIGKLLEKEKIKRIFGIISSLVLLIFGIMLINKALMPSNKIILGNEWTIAKAFISCFLLTISSPLTIVFWSSIFASKAIEKNYSKSELSVFGIGAGLATILFLSIVMYIISMIKKTIPVQAITILNILVGAVIIAYGIIRFIKGIKNYISSASTRK
jgi:threonine/homoserine/homoserine lactone efflux protein